MTTSQTTFEERVDRLYRRIHTLLERGETRKAQTILQALLPADQAEIFSELDDDEQLQLLQGLAPETIADILEHLEDEEAAEIAQRLPPERLADILDEMDPDEAADILGDLEPQEADHLLDLLSDEVEAEIRPLLLHPDETAGGIMTSEYLALGQHMWAEKALKAIREWSPDHDYLYYFVVDKDGHLLGVVSLLQLIKAEPKTEVKDIMDPNVISVRVDADQEACAKLMAHYDLTALPVVDEENRLVGVITIDDIIDVLEEEVTEDIQRFGGSEPLDKPYLLTSPLEVFRKRIGWLLLLFVTEMFTGTVLRHFEGVLAQVVALSFYIPLLIGTGGNAGSQTTSTIIRAVAVGDLDVDDAWRAFRHEITVGVLLGLGMGIVAFLRALSWGSSVDIALTVGIAIWTIVTWANSIGSLLPLLAVKLKIDPALVSGPLMSTLVDATGLFIYLSVAKFILHL